MSFRRWIPILILVLFSLIVGCAGGDDDDDSGEDHDAQADDTAVADDTLSDDTGDDTTAGPGWDGITISDISAPDRTSVLVALSASPGLDAAEDISIYTLDSDRGQLTVTGASLDESDNTLTLTTDKQKLGVTYTLTVQPGGEKGDPIVSPEFLAADTAQFYAYSFDDGSQYQVTTYRAGVGENCVIYIQDGQSAADVDETINLFDTQIYPIETSTLIAAPDMDGNGRILLLGLDGGDWYGGYFDPTNTLTDEQSMEWWGIHSNEMEIVHVNVLWQTLYPVNVVAHEFGHLLYHERHGFQSVYWDYHDEGLAETAVHLVFGVNQYAIDYYLADPNGIIGQGLSVVHWTYAQYENYVQAYLWWVYLAGRLGGIDHVPDIFNLDTGDPSEVNDLIADSYSGDMPTSVLQSRLAIWTQSASGPYSFNGLLSFAAASAPPVLAGTESLDLEPYAGAFFRLDQTSVPYPGTQGAHIEYYGVNSLMAVDDSAPFDITGGVLLVGNTGVDTDAWPEEHSGPDLPAIDAKFARTDSKISPAWNDPPPIRRDHPEIVAGWRAMRAAQIANER